MSMNKNQEQNWSVTHSQRKQTADVAASINRKELSYVNVTKQDLIVRDQHRSDANE